MGSRFPNARRGAFLAGNVLARFAVGEALAIRIAPASARNRAQWLVLLTGTVLAASVLFAVLAAMPALADGGAGVALVFRTGPAGPVEPALPAMPEVMAATVSMAAAVVVAVPPAAATAAAAAMAPISASVPAARAAPRAPPTARPAAMGEP